MKVQTNQRESEELVATPMLDDLISELQNYSDKGFSLSPAKQLSCIGQLNNIRKGLAVYERFYIEMEKATLRASEKALLEIKQQGGVQ